MSASDGSSPEMAAHTDLLRLDDGTVERLLRGEVSVDDAPPRYRDVAAMLAALGADASRSELDGEERVVSCISRQLAEGAVASSATRSNKHKMSTRRRLQLATASLVGGTILMSGLAAAGALPGAAQGIASDMLDQVGVSVPAPNTHSDGHADQRGNSTTHSSDASTDGDSNGKGATISDLAHSDDTTGVDKGAEVSSTASNGKSQAGVNGPDSTPAPESDASPPVETPNPGGTGTADTASSGSSTNGTSNATDHSDGRSAAGGDNASDHRP